MTATSILLSLLPGGIIKQNPTALEYDSASSNHVLAFTNHGDLLLAESEGSFTLEDWDRTYEKGRQLCCGGTTNADDDVMQDEASDEGTTMMMDFVKSALRDKLTADLHWKP